MVVVSGGPSSASVPRPKDASGTASDALARKSRRHWLIRIGSLLLKFARPRGKPDPPGGPCLRPSARFSSARWEPRCPVRGSRAAEK